MAARQDGRIGEISERGVINLDRIRTEIRIGRGRPEDIVRYSALEDGRRCDRGGGRIRRVERH